MKTFGVFILLAYFLFSCSTDSKKQFEHAGGSLKMAVEIEPSTHIARDVTDYYTATVLGQVVEGLISIDPKTLKIVPQIAKGWEISNDGLMYTFSIRENVLFHPHELLVSEKDRKLTLDDIVKSVEKSCSPGQNGDAPHAFNFLFKDNLKGANEFYSGASKNIEGLKTSGKNKITFELLQKDDNFLFKMANICGAISPAKLIAANREADLIGTGPFIFKGYISGDVKKALLVKNEDYYLTDDEGNALPYLDTLTFIFQGRKLDQLEMFENHETDLITGLPPSRITMMLEGRIKDFNSSPPLFVMYNNPLLSTHYYFFNMNDPRFQNVKVRQAFNCAIDKEKLGREVLRNQYYELGYFGIVPPISSSFRGYDFNGVREASYDFDPEKAKKLLAEAGYPNGKGFGSVNLRYNIGDIHSAVADEFAQQIFQVLNINVNIDGSTFEQKDLDASKGKGDIFRSAWAGDYPNPETFLSNFYGKWVPEDVNELSRVNQSRYKNSLFDQLFEQAKNSSKLSEAMAYYAKAERILMQDPPLIPLWYSGDIQIVYSDVRNLHFNSLNQFQFREVYKKPLTEEEYQKQIKEISR
ncbi:MAG: peptide ABC transporter substrate-binding protein [Bacteroidetes bacterium]|nr:MAG: peptide ABC transporter substrate-binding protein [Bacteroidota bacterium]